MLDNYREIHNVFWSSSGWLLLYLVCSFLCLWGINIHTKVDSKSLVATTLIVVLIMYNPIVVFVMKHFFGGNIEYTRIGWGILLVPMISITLAGLIAANKKYITVTVGAVCLVLLFSLKQGSYFCKAENEFKVSSEAVTIIDAINERDRTMEYNYIALICPVSEQATSEMTEYDWIYVSMHSYSTKHIAMPLSEKEIEARGFYTTYVVTDLDTKHKSFMKKHGYVEIFRTEHCIVYELEG